MSFTISLPASEIYTPANAPQNRAFGDPGTTEQFALPQYIYIYIVKYNGSGDRDDDASWILWETITKSVDDEPGSTAEDKIAAWKAKWEKKRYSGSYDTYEDYVYEYTETVNQLLGDNGFDGRVYVVASAVPLTLTSVTTITKGTSTLADVLEISFRFDGGKAYDNAVQANLQNIYSTPYNYKGGGEDYYGSFYASQNVPHFNLLLYHVAAKVDLMWSVAEDKRIKADPAVRLTYLGVQNLFAGQAYCFKPMRNELSSKIDDENGYGIANIVTASDEGLWWEGRDYFYTIPYVVKDYEVDGKVYFPLQMLMQTNGSSDTCQLTLNMRIDTSAVFVPWLRANFNLKRPLDESETKFVD